MKRKIELILPEIRSSYASVHIDGVEVGYAGRTDCEALVTELEADESKAEMLYRLFTGSNFVDEN